jgi:hypothetical protein
MYCERRSSSYPALESGSDRPGSSSERGRKKYPEHHGPPSDYSGRLADHNEATTAVTAYMIQVLSLLRMNSEIVKKGSPCIFITVVVSRCRGPVSPAGKISISEVVCRWLGRRTDGGEGYLDRRDEPTVRNV